MRTRAFLTGLLAGCFLMLAVGCRAQVPPASSYKVNLTWNAPAASAGWSGCTASAPCTYAVYRAAATGNTACPASSSTAWQEITTPSTRPSADAYSDTTASGLDVCYVVETVQGAANSGPSNTYNATVPATPGAPGTLAGSALASLLLPAPAALPDAEKELALAAPGGLRER